MGTFSLELWIGSAWSPQRTRAYLCDKTPEGSVVPASCGAQILLRLRRVWLVDRCGVTAYRSPSAFEPGPGWAWGGPSQGLSKTVVQGPGQFLPQGTRCQAGRGDVSSVAQLVAPCRSCLFPSPFKASVPNKQVLSSVSAFTSQRV